MPLRRLLILLAGFFCLLIPVQAQPPSYNIDTMSLEEKVGQMFVMSFFGEDLNFAARDLLSDWQPGAVVLLPSNLDNPVQITRLTNSIQQTLIDSGAPPAFIAVDQEGGLIARLEEGFTQWTVPSLLTATQNPDLAYQFGTALAEELLAVGINMNFAPVADLQTNLANPIIGRRSFGNDPDMVAPIIASVIEGMQDNGVLATVKHFPGHGDTDADSHLELPVLNLTENDLLARELIPFQSAIAVDSGAVMVAHIYFPQIMTQADTPASLSETIIQDLLRDSMGYEGIVITDALDMDAIDTVYSASDAAIAAVQAGNDLVLIGAHISPENQITAMQAVVDAIHSGQIPESRIDASVRRILAAKERFNLFAWSELELSTVEDRINSEAHTTLIESMFQQGITLVHDNADLIPLEGSTLMVYPDSRARLGLECNRNGWQFATITSNPSDEHIAAITDAVRYVDNVIVFTENVLDNSQQAELVESLPVDKTIIVALWSPFDNQYLPPISTYFVTYSPLSQSYTPICDILHGEAEAQGTLSLMLEAQ